MSKEHEVKMTWKFNSYEWKQRNWTQKNDKSTQMKAIEKEKNFLSPLYVIEMLILHFIPIQYFMKCGIEDRKFVNNRKLSFFAHSKCLKNSVSNNIYLSLRFEWQTSALSAESEKERERERETFLIFYNNMKQDS